MTRRVNLDTEITAAEWKMVARNGNRGEVDALRCRNMGRSPGCARAAADCCVKVNSQRFYYANFYSKQFEIDETRQGDYHVGPIVKRTWQLCVRRSLLLCVKKKKIKKGIWTPLNFFLFKELFLFFIIIIKREISIQIQITLRNVKRFLSYVCFKMIRSLPSEIAILLHFWCDSSWPLILSSTILSSISVKKKLQSVSIVTRVPKVRRPEDRTNERNFHAWIRIVQRNQITWNVSDPLLDK